MVEHAALAFKPHLRAHVVGDREVALIGERGRYALRGSVYAAVAPLIDGARSADEIVAALEGRVPPEMVYFAISRLQQQGFLHDALPRAALSDAGWWQAAFGDDVAAHVPQWAHVRVESIGVDAALARRLEDELPREIRNVASPVTLVVALVDDYLRPEVQSLAAACRAEGGAFLPVRPVGLSLWVGPLCRPEEQDRWPSLLARLRLNRTIDVTALEHGASFPILPLLGTRETTSLGLALTAAVVVRIARGQAPPGIGDGVVTLDTVALEFARHRLVCSPREEMRSVPAFGDDAEPWTLAPAPKRFTADGGHRVCTPEETLQRLQPLVSPITGVVPFIERVPSDDGIYVFTAGQLHNVELRNAPRSNRILGRPDSASGKGQTEAQARASCIGEAVERFSCGYFADVPRRTAALAELGDHALHPDDWLLFSARQYALRDELNAGREPGTSFNYVPEPFAPAPAIEWTPAWSLTHHRTRWLPTALCYFGYGPAAPHQPVTFGQADSNGCAAGNTREEALQQALFELIERDACALWWYNRARRPAIELSGFDDPFFHAMERRAKEQDRELHVLDLRTDIGIPVAVAVSWRRNDGGAILLGLGCHLDARIAVSRALTELNQMAGFNERMEPGMDISGMREYDALQWMASETIAQQPYMVPLEDVRVEARDLPVCTSRDITDDVRDCVARLSALGHEVLALDLTRPDVGFPTVRAVVPGLRHFWSRLAPGRLYDVPVRLGWVDAPVSESALNPIAFFL